MDERTIKIKESADYISKRAGCFKPEIGIILGSGLGKLGDRIENPIIIPYSEIPNFAKSTAIGHKGNMILGTLSGRRVCAMQGRYHYYEGYPMETVTFPVRVMKLLGIDYLFVSNASGGLNPNFHVGDLMIIKDHISLFPNPLIGQNNADFGERFPDMTCAYDLDMIAKAEAAAKELGIEVRKGVYLGDTGPTYETPAEVRMYRLMGGDAVGMSTIPEVIVARHCGITVFGMSVVTNVSNDDNINANLNDGDDVVRIADAAADRMCSLFEKVITLI